MSRALADSVKTKIISRAMAFFVIAALFFNCAFAGMAGSVNVSEAAEVQKNVFSAVMFVSDVISKISVNLSEKISPYAKTSSAQSDGKQKNDEAVPRQDFILASQTQQIKQIKDFSSYVFSKAAVSAYGSFGGKTAAVFKADRSIAFIFLILMIFFIFTKNPYDDAAISHSNNINIEPSQPF